MCFGSSVTLAQQPGSANSHIAGSSEEVESREGNLSDYVTLSYAPADVFDSADLRVRYSAPI